MATEVSADQVRRPQVGPGPETAPPLPCPRCHSSNTKFCYYNNYNSSQPRHFCKSCRRYWTHGGTLRDIPVGGGTRKSSKRSRTASHSLSSATTTNASSSSEPIQATPVFVSASSFTSLLSGGGIMGLNGFGLGLEDVGFGGGPQRGGVCWSFPNEVAAAGMSVMSHSRGGGDHNSVDLGSGLTSQGDNSHVDGQGQGQGCIGLTRGDTWQVETGGDCCFASVAPELAISTPVNGTQVRN